MVVAMWTLFVQMQWVVERAIVSVDSLEMDRIARVK